MKQLTYILALILVLGAVVPGCHEAPRYDGRLAQADSLMLDKPDSALALLEGLDGATLATKGDSAYRDLLLTQARYKAYITATSDSDINRALAYYRAHPKEREKLTRAYIYKGAVMEELGHPDSAMIYYKHAEANADHDDYFNTGYVKLRIGELYQSQLSNNKEAVDILMQSWQCFDFLKDTSYLIVVDGALGSVKGFDNNDSCKLYLNQAITLTQEFNPLLQYTYKSKLAGLYFAEKNYSIANMLAMDVFNNGRSFSYDNQFYYYAAYSFLKLNQIDSAQFIMSQTPEPMNLVDSMNRYELLAELARSNHDNKTFGYYLALSQEISSHLLIASKESAVTKTEMRFEVDQLKKAHSNTLYGIIVFKVLLVVAVFFIMALVFKYRTSKAEKKRIKESLETEIERLKSEQNKSDSVSSLVRCRIDALKELYQSIRIKSQDENKTKRIIPLSSLFKSMNDNNEILDIDLSESFWKKMRRSVDGEYHGILSFIEKRYPSLTEQDLQLFCLFCSHLSPQIIKHCMNYSNAKTVSNYRKKLIKVKMGLDMSFDDFVQQYLSGKLD